MEVKPIMDKHTNYNELDSKNVSDQTSSDNLSNDNIVHQQSTIQNEESRDNRLMAMLIYLLSLFTGIIGPLIIWLIKRKESRLVDVSGKTYLNYFISYTIYSTVGVICMFMIVPLMNISESLAIVAGGSLYLISIVNNVICVYNYCLCKIYVWQNLHYPTHDTVYKISYINTESL